MNNRIAFFMLVYCLSEDSRHAGSLLGLLVYCLSEGFKVCWESLRSAGLLP